MADYIKQPCAHDTIARFPSRGQERLTTLVVACVLCCVGGRASCFAAEPGLPITTLPITLELTNPAAVDQDDLCFWVHPTDPSASCFVVSDKSANKLFVYDLLGQCIQAVDVPQPGNIDIRQDTMVGERHESVIVVNDRLNQWLAVFLMNSVTRELKRIDEGNIPTGENYGGTLFVDSRTNELFFVTTSKESGVTQFRLRVGPDGKAGAERVRHWALGMCEGAVGDDAKGHVYVSVETDGIYRLPGRTDDLSPPERVIAVGANGFLGDAEGITLIRPDGDTPLLIVSDQGSSQFRVYEVEPGYSLRTIFAIADVERTDGIDVTLKPMGPQFPGGALACHSDRDEGRTMRVVDARELTKILAPAE